MANFKYKALSLTGEEVSGLVEGISQMDAVARIKQSCPVIIEIKEVKDAESIQLTTKKISVQTLSLMCDRFAIILGVGLPIVRAVDMLADQMEDKYVKGILTDIAKDVSMGRSLYASFAARGKVFPVTFLESIRSGEESGELVLVFARLKEYYERTNKTKQKVTSSLMYPMFTMVVAVIVVIIVMVVGVPIFSESFAANGMELPGITKLVINVSNFFINYGIFLGIALVIGGFAFNAYARTDTGAEAISIVLLALPIVGKIVQLSAASQFAHTMSMMLTSGMPILRCLETAGKSVSNFVMRRDILEASVGVEEGKALGTCLRQSKYLPAMLIEMTAMGETTGTMESTLEAVGRYYDNEVEISTAKATSLLEPAIICMLAVVVVIILFSVYLPMFSMY